jgi:hypothetical protein
VGAPETRSAGLRPARATLISGSGGGYGGVLIDNSTSILVQGNYIGTDITGTNSQGNAFGGIFIVGAKNNTIGGTTAAAGNLISGNAANGIYITDATNFYGLTATATGNVVQGNFIGTDVSGTVALPNSASGVLVVASSNTIAGTASGAGNVISGNGQTGVIISAVGKTGTLFDGSGFVGARANLVQGNFIGTNLTGTAGLGNGTIGNLAGYGTPGVLISAGATNNTIGGTVSGARNVISGNLGIYGFGVSMDGAGTTGNLVQGNFVGTNAAGTAAIAGSKGEPAAVPNRRPS